MDMESKEKAGTGLTGPANFLYYFLPVYSTLLDTIKSHESRKTL